MTWWELMVRSMATPMGNMVTEVDGEVSPIEALPSAVASSWHSYDIISFLRYHDILTISSQLLFEVVNLRFTLKFPETLLVIASYLFLGIQARKKLHITNTNFSILHRKTQKHSTYLAHSLNHLKVIKYPTTKTTPPTPNVSKLLGTHTTLLHHSPRLFRELPLTVSEKIIASPASAAPHSPPRLFPCISNFANLHHKPRLLLTTTLHTHPLYNSILLQWQISSWSIFQRSSPSLGSFTDVAFASFDTSCW